MFVMVAGRQLGKTTLLVNWWLEAPEFRGILTFDNKSRLHVIRHIGNMISSRGADPKRFLEIAKHNVITAVDAVAGGMRAGYIQHWAVDDLDRVLPALFGGQIELITATATLIPNFGSHKPTVNGEAVDVNDREIETRRAIAGGSGQGGVARTSSDEGATTRYIGPGPGRDYRMGV